MKILLLLVLLSGCGEYVVTGTGVHYEDNSGEVPGVEIDKVMHLIYDNIPDPDDYEKFWDHVVGVHVEMLDVEVFESGGDSVVGTANAGARRVKVAFNPCGSVTGSTWAGTLAHEMGHILGHDHNYQPWFGRPESESHGGVAWAVRDYYCPLGMYSDPDHPDLIPGVTYN